MLIALILAATISTPVCEGVATRDVLPAAAGTWCPVSEVPLAEQYCDGSQPEVCAFLRSLPSEAQLRCIVDAPNACAVTVAQEGDRNFYALSDSPALEALARVPRWTEAPVSLMRADDGTFWFDPRHCPGCSYSSPQLQLLFQHGLPSDVEVLDQNVTFNARNCTLSVEVPRSGEPPVRVNTIVLNAVACASESEYWDG